MSNYTNATDVQIQFNGITGVDYDSDIGIDAIRIIGETTTNLPSLTDTDNNFLYLAPNPFKDYIAIETNIQTMVQYTITDVQGRDVKSGRVNEPFLDLKELGQGVYFIRFSYGKAPIVRKIVKY